ncbi:MAG: VOC family protein [Deltaproteobacteria bacterium]|nr:VOC family protein [Deltaproteobacteria bacterium]
MAYKTNHFCWHGIITTDLDKATAFYGSALPFDVQTADMGGEPVAMVAAAEIPRAHIALPQMDGVPSHWSSYFRVEDVDASTNAAVAAGGTLVVPGTDIPPGRFSVVSSPSGATFCLFHEADEATSQNAPGGTPGSVHWTELWSKDIDADLAWLNASFGITTETMEMPSGPYYLLQSGEETIGGAMTSTEEKAPSMWLPWIEVSDVDATVTSIDSAGGNAVSPLMDVPNVGRMAVVSDPTGGVFGVITPAPRG